RDRLKGEAGRFREKYVPAVAEEHRYLKLVGIHGKEGLPPPLLQEVYVSLRMGGTDAGDPLAPPLSIGEAMGRHSHLVILGEPGAGKSTLLDWLALVFAGEIESADLARPKDCLPVFMPLRNCVSDERPLHELMADPALLPLDDAPPEDFFKHELEQGRCLILLDGLDEVIDERQRKRAAGKINDLLRTFPNNRCVVTCRTAGWKEGLLPGNLARLYAREFEDGDIERFVRGWYKAVRCRAAQLRGDLRPEAQRKAVERAEQRARGEARALLAGLKGNRGLYMLARNPLILSLIALVHYRRRDLPQGRAKLYQECLEILLNVWDQEDKDLDAAGPSLKAKETILREIAYHFHDQELAEAGRDELEALVAPLIEALDCPTNAAETLRQIEERSGILVSKAIGRYGFAHRTLQEYLVARVLADSPQKAAEVLTRVNDEPWREVILLYVGLIGDASELVEALLARPDDYNALTLAVQCLSEDVQVTSETRDRALERFETAFGSVTNPLDFIRLGETMAALQGNDAIS
ncbi:MAG: NACHT domain-containing protein, partial [Delftia sp.]|nr:NACHT domain-containing protein [Delftia sp.]